MKWPKELEKDLAEELVQLLWDQWVSIGVAGGATAGAVPFVIDPEALLLATTQFGLGDARLRGEMFDWLQLNGQQISIARLKNLQKGVQVGNVQELLGMTRVLAETSNKNKNKNWRSLESLANSAREQGGKGCNWRKVKVRKMSQRPDPQVVAAFCFKMRSFFGMNARAEIFTWLLTHEAGHAAAIARETGWFSKTVQLTLNDLERSGLVHVYGHASEDGGAFGEGEAEERAKRKRKRRREKLFRIDRERWRFLWSQEEELAWFPQGYFYLGCRHVLATLSDLAGAKDASAGFQSIKIRERLAATAVSFEKAGMGQFYSAGGRLSGSEVVEYFERSTRKLIRVMREREGFLGF